MKKLIAVLCLTGSVAFAGPPPKEKAPPADAPVALASVPSEGKMNEYLMAHQGFSPSTAIQGLAPYIRSVSATHTTKGRE